LDTSTADRIDVVTDALTRTAVAAASDADADASVDAGYHAFARLAALQRETDGTPSLAHAQHIAREFTALGLSPARVAGWYVRFERAHHLDGSPARPHHTAPCIGTALWDSTQPHLKPPADHAATAWLLRQLFIALIDLGFDSVSLDDLLDAKRTFGELVAIGPSPLGVVGGA
jgi:hypothetical protein